MPSTQFIGPREAPDLHVMSFNIRRKVPFTPRDDPDRWSTRAPRIRAFLGREQPALLGVQEAMPQAVRLILRALGPSYRSIGYGRNSNKLGERTPIFYDSRRLRLETWMQLALSETPDVPGSRGWGNRIPRMVVSGLFTDLATGSSLHFLNTHFDHESQRARVRSAVMIAELVRDVPAIITGDFNTDTHTSPYRSLVPPLADVFEAAPKKLSAEWGTFPDYGAPTHDRKRIDWMLATPGIEIVSAGIDARGYPGNACSDHLAVQAVVRL